MKRLPPSLRLVYDGPCGTETGLIAKDDNDDRRSSASHTPVGRGDAAARLPGFCRAQSDDCAVCARSDLLRRCGVRTLCPAVDLRAAHDAQGPPVLPVV